MKPTPLSDVRSYLAVETPTAWTRAAASDWQTLLLDHVECEKKAAASAVSLLHRYGDRRSLVRMAARLAREELRHVEQVDALRVELKVPWRRLTPARYAAALKREIHSAEPWRLIDTLLVAALIEARSCERFACLQVALPPGPMRDLYGRLQESESRHFQGYWNAALEVGVEYDEVAARQRKLAQAEGELASAPDTELRFHSGPPAIGHETQGFAAAM